MSIGVYGDPRAYQYPIRLVLIYVLMYWTLSVFGAIYKYTLQD